MRDVTRGKVDASTTDRAWLLMLPVGSLATVVALHSDTGEAEAQTSVHPMTTICLEYTTGLYKGIISVDGELDVLAGSTITGGAGGTGASVSAPGGGIFGESTLITISDSTAIGGTGGRGIGNDAERGGHGVHVFTNINPSNTLIATNATITRGNGGAGTSEGQGAGAPALLFLQIDPASWILDLQTNVLAGGSGDEGLAASLFVHQSSTIGSVCVNAAGNTATDDFVLLNSTVNGGVTVDTTGTITFGCVIAP